MLTELKTTLKSLAQDYKVTQYDLFGVSSEDQSACSLNKEPFQASASQKTSVTLRVWSDANHVGLASTSHTSKVGIEKAFKLAYEASKLLQNDPIELSPESLKTIESNNKKNTSLSPLSDLMTALIKAETVLLEDKNIKTVDNEIVENNSTRFYLSSQGAERVEEKSMAYCYLYPLSEREGSKTRQAGESDFASKFQDLNVSDVMQKAHEKLNSYLTYKSVSQGT